ncbi:heme ABC exporter ATP-binding protein CcmA [Nonomuraea sp. LP-02]|uniref:heme ABC exporter ATP-binding protein CcmA n=1 Tax=Nonomuraea sp. LP-02 TaxID=3097960 RepID=UPI002E3697AA|nr:heme ABC exporter ATP-binding protein CcmA [Nonomuraea sp. LP-02]MED7926422.1 heme ABC exporter ATP-binding protein CcmA [Nonomuraea sp. LP-02]
MNEPIISVENLTVELGGNPVLRELTLTVSPGEIVAVVGPNGSGKSTLLRTLAGLQPASGGEVRVFGAPPVDDAAFWRRVAHLGDEPAWYPGLTAGEHLELMAAVHPRARMDAGTALEVFDLVERADAAPLNLSTGQRQRLALAATLLRPSSVLLLDEPERGLDLGFRLRLAELLTAYRDEGGTVVMATHDSGLAAHGRLISPVGMAA